jgi:hypothetical protein
MKGPDQPFSTDAATPEQMSASLRTLTAALIGGSLAAVAGIIHQIITRYPVNHVGYDIRQLYLLAGIAIAAGALLLKRRSEPTWLAMSCLLAGGGLAAAILLAHVLNLLVEYESWGSRHLPAPFQITW